MEPTGSEVLALKEFSQVEWDERLEAEFAAILELAVREDLGDAGDWTSRAVVDEGAAGVAAVVAREEGTISGLRAGRLIARRFDPQLDFKAEAGDGDRIVAGSCVARIKGPARALLAAERTLLNTLGRLSGIATLTRRYVDAVAGTSARIYDTRKTTPGWRRLEKYAVRCGGGRNHRSGLFDALLIKDNHLAIAAASAGSAGFSPAEAVRRARRYLAARCGSASAMPVEVEVDTLDQFREVMPAGPDLVLLDNMPPAALCEAVRIRNAAAPAVELEASGGMVLGSVRTVAETGVERISVGALTHAAIGLDLGLDWD